MLAESSFRKSSHSPPPGRFYVRGKKHETSQVVCIVIAHDIFSRRKTTRLEIESTGTRIKLRKDQRGAQTLGTKG